MNKVVSNRRGHIFDESDGDMRDSDEDDQVSDYKGSN
jgi:hypothetical protein